MPLATRPGCTLEQGRDHLSDQSTLSTTATGTASMPFFPWHLYDSGHDATTSRISCGNIYDSWCWTKYSDSDFDGTCASLGIPTSPIWTGERPFKTSSAFLNISSSLAALGSAAGRAASIGRTSTDKDMVLSPLPSSGVLEQGDCFILLSLDIPGFDRFDACGPYTIASLRR